MLPPTLQAPVAAFRRVLGSRRLRRLLGSFFLFGVAEWGTWVTILVWAYQVKGAGFVGVVAAIQLVFAAVAAPVFSMAGDRMPRGRALSLTYLWMAVALVVTGVALLADVHIILTLVLASVAAATFSVGRPLHASLIPDLADEPTDAVAANVVSSIFEGAGTFVGPALAGLIMMQAEPGWVFIVLAVGTAVSALALGGMGRVARAGGLGEASDAGMFAAFRLLADAPRQRYVVLLGAVSQLVGGALDILTVVLALEVLGLGDSGAGYLVALLGLGGLAGGFLAASMVGRRLAPVLIAGALLRGGALVVLGVEPTWLFLLLVSGAGFSLLDVGVRTMLQRLVAPDVMSRVFGVLESVGLAALAAGSLIASGVVAAVGVDSALAIFGVLIPLTVVVGYTLLVHADREAYVPTEVIAALGSVPLFSLLSPPALEVLARRSRIVQHEGGEVVIREGELTNFVLLVIEGGLRVTKGDRHLADLGFADIVGEIAAMESVPRTATVTAVERVTAISVPGDAFVAAVRGETEAWSMSTSVAGRRLQQQQA